MIQLLFLCFATFHTGGSYKKLAIVEFDTVEEDGRKVGEARVLSKKDDVAKQLMEHLEYELKIEFDIVERRKLDAIRKEHNLHVEADPSKVWSLLEADCLLTGTVTDYIEERRVFNSKRLNIKREIFHYTLSLSYKLIDTKTGRLITVGQSLTQTNSRKLRNQGLSEHSVKLALCRDAAKDIRLQIKSELKAIRDAMR